MRFSFLALVLFAMVGSGCAVDTEEDDDGDASETSESALSGGLNAYKILRKGSPYDRPMNHNDAWADLRPNVRADALAGKLQTHDRNGTPLARLLRPHARGGNSKAKGDVKIQFNESVVIGRDRWFYVWGNGTGGGSGFIPGNWLSREPRPSGAEDFGNGGNPRGTDTVKLLVAKGVPSDFRFCRSQVREPDDKDDESYDDYGAKSSLRYADGTSYQPLTWNLPDVPGGGIVRTAVEDGAEVHLLDALGPRVLYDESCKASTKKREGERHFRVKVTKEDRSRWVEFRYAWVVPGKTRAGAKAAGRAYGWILSAHGVGSARVEHLK